MTLTVQPYTKHLLTLVLGISSKTLGRYLNKNQSKLLTEFPEYNTTDKRLHPNIFKFICSEHGISNDEIAERMKIIQPGWEQVSIERIRAIYGL